MLWGGKHHHWERASQEVFAEPFLKPVDDAAFDSSDSRPRWTMCPSGLTSNFLPQGSHALLEEEQGQKDLVIGRSGEMDLDEQTFQVTEC